MARDLALILGTYPCTRNFHHNGPMRVEEVRRDGDELCPLYHDCPVAEARGAQLGCAMVRGLEVALRAITTGTPVADVVYYSLRPWLERDGSPRHYVSLPHRHEPHQILDKEHERKKLLESIRDYAVQVLGFSPEDGWAAYDIPPQSEPVSQGRQMILVRQPTGKVEINFIQD